MILGSVGRSWDRTVRGGMRWDVVAGDELEVTRAIVEQGCLWFLCRRGLLLSKEICRAGESTSQEPGRIEGMSRAAQGATKAAR